MTERAAEFEWPGLGSTVTLTPGAKEASREARADAMLPKRLLLAYYLVIPLSFLLIAGDRGFGSGSFWEGLPFPPERILLIGTVFNFPHIVASVLLLLDPEYLATYWRKLLMGLLAMAVIILGIYRFFGWNALLGAGAAYTIYHVIGQQFGIAAGLIGKPVRGIQAWRWTGILGCVCIMIVAFTGHKHQVIWLRSPRLNLSELFERGALLFVLAFTALSAWVVRAATDRTARVYTLANFLLVLACYGCCLIGQSFFAVLMPRAVHDLTAFSFYVVHDRNRNRGAPINYLHRLACLVGIPSALVTPLFGGALAFPLTLHYADQRPAFVWFFMIVGAFHYFIESFTWRRGSPYRKHVALR